MKERRTQTGSSYPSVHSLTGCRLTKKPPLSWPQAIGRHDYGAGPSELQTCYTTVMPAVVNYGALPNSIATTAVMGPTFFTVSHSRQ
jgi:hypothetical protein